MLLCIYIQLPLLPDSRALFKVSKSDKDKKGPWRRRRRNRRRRRKRGRRRGKRRKRRRRRRRRRRRWRRRRERRRSNCPYCYLPISARHTVL